MLNLSRIAAVCLTVVAGVSVLFTSLFDSAETDVAFGEVLARLESVEMLHAELTRGDEQAEVWIRSPGVVRWQDSPGRYRIAQGSRLWRIDEETNTVTTEDSPWFREAGRSIGVFDVLGLDETDRSVLEAAEPTGVEEYDQARCLTYRIDVPSGVESFELVAYADVETHLLRGLIVRDPAAAGARPVAEMRLIAMDEPVDESLFVVAESLSEDGRIGKVLAAQGIVSLKPVMNRRWTPVGRQMLVKPGDWLRTDVRGANASLAALTTSVQVTVGPASLVEFISPREVRLHQGTAQVHVASDMPEPFCAAGTW